MPKTIQKIILLLALAASLTATTAAAEPPQELIPVGSAVGLAMQTDEVVIASLSDKEDAARRAGLKQGDIIKKLNQTPISSVAELTELLRSDTVITSVTVERQGLHKTMKISPRQTENGQVLGIYVRDSLAGIGTLTYYDPRDGSFGALGHGVSDALTKKRLRLTDGAVVNATVAEIEKGSCGKPGALRGILGHTGIGTVQANTGVGVFGTLDGFFPRRPPAAVASWEQVHTGKAEILSTLTDGQTNCYRITILNVYRSEDETRNFILRVEDERLLKQTGGIVQGMSGSPILQDGRLVGAVTHVLVDDPTTGYGVFIGNMLQRAEKIQKAA